MAPPLIFLAFVILVLAIIGVGALIAIRAGLWARETSAGKEPPGAVGEPEPRDAERPEHVEVSDPGHHRFVGTRR